MPPFSLAWLGDSRPEDFRDWASGGALLGAAGYSLVALFVFVQQQSGHALHAPLLAATALACWLGFFVARRHSAFVGASIAFGALWFEIHASFVITPGFPSTGLLATPVMAIAAGLLYGSRISLVASVASVLVTTPLYLLSPAATPGFLGTAGIWLVVHGVVTLGAWGLMSLGLLALRRMVGALRAREQELNLVISEAPDGIVVLAGDNRIVSANPAAQRLLCAPELDAGETTLAQALSAAGARDVDALIARLFLAPEEATPDPLLWELAADGAAGTFVEVTQRQVAKDRWQLMLRDVSPRVNAAELQREAEQRTAHAQRLEAVGLLAGGIAHDFNNLLLAIGANAELLRGERREEERATLLDELAGAQARGAALTRQLLAFARKDVMHATVFDLGALVFDLHFLLDRVAGDLVNVRCAAIGDARVHADRLQLEQVLVNLVANARDAMPAGGMCTVSVEGVDADTLHGRVRVTVTDVGTGMDAETAARAFEPFFTTKPRGRGTGLGLSTAHGIVAQCQGQLTIESTPGKGTTVAMTLPHASRTLTAPDAPAATLAPRLVTSPPPGRQATARILVADDDDGTRAVVGRILSSAGYASVLVPDGEQALRALEQTSEPFDLVLSDVVMPVLDGPGMARRVKARRPECPILFMSGYPESGFEGIDDFDAQRDFLEKPFTSAELLRRIGSRLAVDREG